MRTVVFIFLIAFVVPVYCAISCLNEQGKPVDWWVILKFPTNPTTSNSALATGYAYAYGDSTTNTLTISSNQLNKTPGALGLTISQIYDASPTSVGWMMYDDQTPDDNSHSSYGHTKGEVAFDSNQGFWLIHSVPRFPNATGPYFFPDYEKTYGQSFLCVTYATTTFNTIGSLFLLNKPFIYSSNLPTSLASIVPNMNSVLDGKWITTSATQIADLYSVPNNYKFTAFAKNSQWNNDLYEYLVQPHFNNGAYWETWMNGVNPLPTYCTPTYKYDSINIIKINFQSQASWTETKDHSKWGVLFNSTYVCIGDINRMASQAGRGGGTACFKNDKMWKVFTDLILTADSC